MPVIKNKNDQNVFCYWEREKKIQKMPQKALQGKIRTAPKSVLI